MNSEFLTPKLRLALHGVLLLIVPAETVSAQTSQQNAWQNEVQPKLRAIYELGEWRAKRFEAQWVPDSSGYRVTERKAGNQQDAVRFYHVESGEHGEMPSIELAAPLRSPDGKRVVEFRDKNLFVRDLADDSRKRLTDHSNDREIFYRQPTWSPDGKRVLFIEFDETAVRKRSVLIPADPSYPKVEQHRFARVGESIPRLRVGVVDADTAELRWLPIDSPPEGFYLGQVEWAGDSDEVLIETLSRFRDRREFLLINVAEETPRKIFSETNPAWAVASQGKNLGLMWLNEGQQFIVISEKDGWRHAFLYTRDGQELATLTPGEYDIIDRVAVDAQRGWFYFNASPNDATQRYLYRVPLDGSGTLERVTPDDQPGTHDYTLSPDNRWAFHTYSRFDMPPTTELVELPSHRSLRVLEPNTQLRKKAEDSITHPTEFLQLDLSDGVTVDAWMIKPRDFDPSKKYPIFVYVYGEPHSQTVLDAWGTAQDQFHRTVADLGYLVVSIDNRGTPAPKGAAWRRSIFGSLGPLSTEEQAAALQQLGRTRPYVDLTRVGIWGWSGGGSNTLNALFRKPEVYHVGIAVVPKPQPHLYNAWFQEIYMRTREVNPDGYQASAPLHFAEGLCGKLLIITGSGETNTHIQIIEGLVDRLIELGKSFDYMVYPNRDHGLREGPGSEVHVRMLVIRYLVENLPRGPG